MTKRGRSRPSLQQLRRWLIVAAVVAGVGWIGFFDSHSVYKRARWHRESARLEADNARLEHDIERLETSLEADLTDEDVERIAREEYGMHREDETVYPVTTDK